jgi:uncharacterized protein YjdB
MKTINSIKIAIILSLVCFTSFIYSQVNGVKYMLKYDPKTDYFDCYLIIADGFAKDIDHRKQFSAKLSLVVPSGTEFSVANAYLPLYNNQNFTGIRPAKWDITTKIKKPKASPRFDYFSFTPDLSEEAHYNQMEAGDTVRLFSLVMDTIVGCVDGVRLFINGSDPDATADDFLNQDLSQFFAIGAPNNVYTTNAILSYPALAGKDEFACKGQTLTLQSIPPGKGKWYLPNGNPFGAELDSSGFNTYKVKFSLKAEKGIYSLFYADSNAYDIKCITVTQPEATITVDSFSCNGGFMAITVNGTGSYLWSPAGTNSTTFRPQANTTYTVTVTDVNGCTASTSISVKALSDIIVPGKNLCIGDTYSLPDFSTATWDTLLSEGKWQSPNLLVATVSANGVVTAISPGIVSFRFRYGDCFIDTEPFTINQKPQITIMGSDNICVGETTTLTSASPGQWISNTPNLININSQGVALGLSHGIASVAFINNASGCISEPKFITVKQKPNVAITGPNGICIDKTTTLSPTSGGIWTSDNIIAASVENNGIVTGLQAGTAQFRFLADNGCFSNLTPIVTVHPTPTLSIMGSDHICIGSNTQLLPSSVGGGFSSSNVFIATVSNNGLVTGTGIGSATFVFTSSFGCVSVPSAPVFVHQKPSISITGPDKICVGSKTTLSSNQNGSWISNAPTVASITPNGIITGLSEGNATFTFVPSTIACDNVVSPVIKVMPLPVVPNSDVALCIGSSIEISTTLNGTWTASPTGIVQINNQIFTSLAVGQTKIIYTDANTGCQSDSILVTVNQLPQVQVIGNDTICVGTTTTLSPSTGGTWSSNNITVASVNNSGLVTAISEGDVSLTFTDSNGCSTTSPSIQVSGILDIQVDDIEICSGAGTTTLPSPDGVWQVSPEGIVSIQDSIVTEITTGTVQLIFYASNGCQSSPISFTINPQPELQLLGNDTICVGSSTALTATLPGTWAGSNFAIADITNNGIITGKSPGTVFFEFSSLEGCAVTSQNITVIAPINIDLEVANNRLETTIISDEYIWYACGETMPLAQTSDPFYVPSNNGSYFVVIDNGICISQSACVDFIIISTKNTLLDIINISPNPASDQITIHSPFNFIKAILTNSLGQNVAETNIPILDVQTLSEGMYYIDIFTDMGNIKKPVIIIK